MKRYSIVFCGIRKYGAIVLKQLLKDERVNIVKVYSQKDDFYFSPSCAEICESTVLPIEYVESWNDRLTEDLERLSFDFLICAWFHLKIPKNAIAIPLIGAVNFHPSLLPAYRGPNPVEWALVNGEIKTGLTAHLLTEEFDKGPVIAKEEIEILSSEDSESLSIRLAGLSTALFDEVINSLDDKNNIRSKVQDESKATYFPRRTVANSYIVWHQNTALQIYNKVRGFFPYPCCRAEICGKPVLVEKVEIIDELPEKNQVPVEGIIFNDYCLVPTLDKKVIKVLKYKKLERKDY